VILLGIPRLPLGLSRSRYQQARERLVARGLLAVDERATGRGRASTVTLVFAGTGPWWDGNINLALSATPRAPLSPWRRARRATGIWCSGTVRRNPGGWT